MRGEKSNVREALNKCERSTYRNHVSRDPPLDVLLRSGVHILFRKNNALMQPFLVLMPSERVSKMGSVSDSTESALTVSWPISLQPYSLGPKL